jgi:hypothetical protein
MSVAKFRDERELKKAGLQLDPVTGEVATIPLAVVWEMTDEEFDAHAAKFSAGQCATMIQEAKNQAIRCFKRGAEWYYAAGRWLLWAKKKNVFAGGWEAWVAFCQDECAISPAQASKYMKFASRFSPKEVAAFSFGDERFSLERALGYEDDSSEDADDGEIQELEEESSEDADDGKEKEPAVSPTNGNEQSQLNGSMQRPEPKTKKTSAGRQKTGKTTKPAPPSRKKWTFGEKTKPEVSVIYPGKFRFRFDDAASLEFTLNRDQAEQTLAQLAAAMEKDDELGTPEQSLEVQCPRLAEGTTQPVK